MWIFRQLGKPCCSIFGYFHPFNFMLFWGGELCTNRCNSVSREELCIPPPPPVKYYTIVQSTRYTLLNHGSHPEGRDLQRGSQDTSEGSRVAVRQSHHFLACSYLYDFDTFRTTSKPTHIYTCVHM